MKSFIAFRISDTKAAQRSSQYNNDDALERLLSRMDSVLQTECRMPLKHEVNISK